MAGDPARELEDEVLRLPRHLRARLAELLIASLDEEVSFDSESESEKAWLREAHERLDALEAGQVDGVPADEALRAARSAIR